LAGPNHTLPTSGAARYVRFGGGNFLKHPVSIQYSPTALQKVAGAIDVLAKAEGLPPMRNQCRTADARELVTGNWERGETHPNPYKAERRLGVLKNNCGGP